MSTKLTYSDYRNILKHYGISIPKTRKQMRMKAEKTMANKMCRCVKRIQSRNESKAIRICTHSLFRRRGLKRGTFRCKPKYDVQMTKTRKTIFS